MYFIIIKWNLVFILNLLEECAGVLIILREEEVYRFA